MTVVCQVLLNPSATSSCYFQTPTYPRLVSAGCGSQICLTPRAPIIPFERRSNVVADSHPFALDASSETLWLLCTLILLSFLSNNLAQGGILLHHIGSSCYLLSLYGGRRLVLTACLFRLLASMLNGNERYRKLKLGGTIKSDSFEGIVSYYSQSGNERWRRRCFRRERGPVMAPDGSIRAGGKCY